MEKNKKLKPPILILGSALLLLLIVLLLISFSLTRPGPEQTLDGASSASSPQKQPAHQSRRIAGPRNPARLQTHPRVVVSGSDPAPTGSTPAAVPLARVQAPPAIPSAITQEKDPVRRKRLMNMHRLATARVRASRLRHRASLLRASLIRAKKDGSWSAEKLMQAQQDLAELTQEIPVAEDEERTIRDEVGGDIDKDAP